MSHFVHPSGFPHSAVLASSLHDTAQCQGGCTAQMLCWTVLFFTAEFTLGMILPTKAAGQDVAAERKLSGNAVQVCWLQVSDTFNTVVSAVPADFAVVTSVYPCGFLQIWKSLGWHCLLIAVIRACDTEMPVTEPRCGSAGWGYQCVSVTVLCKAGSFCKVRVEFTSTGHFPLSEVSCLCLTDVFGVNYLSLCHFN